MPSTRTLIMTSLIALVNIAIVSRVPAVAKIVTGS